jgi:hypothetical protein
MESPPGRRILRPALTLGAALPALAAVAVWAAPVPRAAYLSFVGLTAALLVCLTLARPDGRR